MSVPISKTGSVAHEILSKPAFLTLVDLVIGLTAYVSAWLIRMHVSIPFTDALLPQERWNVVSHPWWILIISQVFFLYILGLYDDLRSTRFREVIAYSFTACVMQVVTVTSLFFLVNPPAEMQRVAGIFPRTVILLFGFLNFAGICFWRLYVKRTLQQRRSRVLVVAEDLASALDIVQEIDRNPWIGLQIVGIAAGGDDAPPEVGNPYPILGDLSRTRELVSQYDVDEIIFASQESWKDRVLNSLTQLQAQRPLKIAILPSVFEIAIGRLRHINIHDTPLIEVRRNPSEPLERFMKRGFDVFFSSFALLLSLPVLILVPLFIRATSRGPAFYLQDRVGLGGRTFRLIKFRTMVDNAEEASGETIAEAGDPRITPVGRILRRFRVDELPQLINVLIGNMSFVGPRPERPGFVDQYVRQLTGYNERHKVKPGITGLAQVRGFYHTAAENKLKFDLAYIYNYSFSLDLLILLETIKVVLIRRGS